MIFTDCLIYKSVVLYISIMAAAKPASCSLNDALSKYLDTLKVSNAGPAKAEIEKVVKGIMKRVEAEDSRFKMGLEFRGSMYEKLKIKEANEIDFDLPLTKLTIDEAPRNGLPNTIPQEYTTYKLRPALAEEWKNLAGPDNNLLSAERVVQRFSDLIRHAVDGINKDQREKYVLDFKTNHPAVTVIFKKDGKVIYDVDLAPVIEVKKWPINLTNGWERRSRKGWPSQELIDDIKKSTVYLVPKLYKDKTCAQRNYLWRFAFNKAEKKLLLDSRKDIDNSCCRSVVKILKGFLVDSDWRGLRSYHIKTILLHEYETYGNAEQWTRDKIGERVKSAVIRLKQCLSQSTGPKLQHYFLPSINIMAGINEDQRLLIIGKLEKFLKNLEAEVSKLNGSAKCTAQKKEKTESTKALVKLARDLLRDMKKIAEEEGSEKMVKLCNTYEKGRFQQLGITDSVL